MPTSEEIKQWITDAIKWHRHDGVLTQLVYLYNLFGFRNRWSYILNLNNANFGIATLTNGTTLANVFTPGGIVPIPFRISVAYVISMDTTAANISIQKNGGTIGTVAKGTSAGLMTGFTSFSDTDFLPGDTCKIVSSSSGNAIVNLQVLFPTN